MPRFALCFLLILLCASACTAPSPKAVPISTPIPPAATSPVPVTHAPSRTPLSSSTPATILSATLPGPANTPTATQPAATPAAAGIGPDSLALLAQLNTFRSFNLSDLSNLSNLMALATPGSNPADLASLFSPPAYVAMAYSPDGQTLALGGCTQPPSGGGHAYACLPPGKPILRIMDVHSGKILRELPGHTAGITGLAFSPDGKILVSASEVTDGSIRFWDTATGSMLRSLKIDDKNGYPALGVSPDGTILVAAWYQHLRAYDFGTGKVLFDGGSSNGVPQFSKDGSILAVYGEAERSSITIYDPATWKLVIKFPIPPLTGQFALSPDGKLLVTGAENLSGAIHFWDATSGKELDHAEDTIAPNAMAFNPDGRILITGGVPKSAKASIPLKVINIWDAAGHKPIGELRAPAVSPNLLAFSPQGDRIASVDLGGSISFWGPANDQIDAARKVLLTYLDDLNQGKFSDAAGLYFSNSIDPKAPEYLSLKKNHPDVNPTNVAAVLQAACSDKRFPCAKFRDTLYQGDFTGSGGISFYVEFAAPDGSALVSPLSSCSKASATCEPTTAFQYNLIPGQNGEFRLTSLPPAASFP